MNILYHTTRKYRPNVGYLLSPLATSSKRPLSTSQWKKYLTILDVNKNSSTKDIKDSFLKLSKVYHPDNKTTGSHVKFVELKEAYDALKDGHPKTTLGSTYNNNSANRYNNYYDTDVSYQAHRAYRDKYKDYTYGQSNYGFGGPYRNSSTPWEDLRRDMEYRRQRDAYNKRTAGGRGLINATILLSAMAWIIIYSSVILIWDYNDSIKKDLFASKTKYRDDYMQYEEYLKKKERARALREEAFKNPRYAADEPKPKAYITSNHIHSINPFKTKAESQVPVSPRQAVISDPVELTPKIVEPEVVRAL